MSKMCINIRCLAYPQPIDPRNFVQNLCGMCILPAIAFIRQDAASTMKTEALEILRLVFPQLLLQLAQ